MPDTWTVAWLDIVLIEAEEAEEAEGGNLFWKRSLGGGDMKKGRGQVNYLTLSVEAAPQVT